MGPIDEELILYTLAQLMTQVRWTRVGDEPDARRFITVSRRVKLFSDVPSSQQPACFQAEWNDSAAQVTNEPYKWELDVNWIIYQSVGNDKGAVPATENNLILDGVRKVLAPQPSDPGFPDERNTLGGLAYKVFISGRVFKDPGDLDNQGMLVVPIKVLVP
jgi:hypothetical protein